MMLIFAGSLKYLTVCRVGGGFNHEELRVLREKLDLIKVPWAKSREYPSLAPWKITKRDDQPDFFFPPDVSVVVQLKCAELVVSDSFSAKMTCRFPRVQRYVQHLRSLMI